MAVIAGLSLLREVYVSDVNIARSFTTAESPVVVKLLLTIAREREGIRIARSVILLRKIVKSGGNYIVILRCHCKFILSARFIIPQRVRSLD